MAYQPKQMELEGGIRHIVYEYGHLVFAGRHTLTAPGKPIDNLIQEAFLMNCRKLAEFFDPRTKPTKIKAAHYCTARQFPGVTLPTMKKWWDAINNQIAHVSYRRVTQPKTWYGHDGTNAALLAEFQAAFRSFLSRVDDSYRSEFNDCLSERSKHLGLALP